MAQNTCMSIKSNGSQCKAPAGPDGYCYWHRPGSAETRKAAAARGGSRSPRPAIALPENEPLTAERARSILAGLIGPLLDGSLPPEVCRACGYILQIEAKLRADDEIEKRVEALEKLFCQRETS